MKFLKFLSALLTILLLVLIGAVAFIMLQRFNTESILPAPELTPEPALSTAAAETPAVTLTPAPTPVPTPTAEPAPTPIPTPALDPVGAFRISELMIKNKAFYKAPDGRCYDWIEIENISDGELSLEGWSIRVGSKLYGVNNAPVLVPGSFAVILCAPDGVDNACWITASLGKAQQVSLVTPAGTDFGEVITIKADDNVSTVYSSGSAVICRFPTPAYENTAEGYSAYLSGLAAPEGLAINEICGQLSTPDAVELRNNSDSDLSLAGYSLSDDRTAPDMFPLPDMILSPGELLVVNCTGDTGIVPGFVCAPFKISSSGDNVYLFKDGSIVDAMAYMNVPADCSVGREPGRNGIFYFAEPTLGDDNRNGLRFSAAYPEVSVPAGVYAESSLTVELSGLGTIYYTTDGSEPSTDSAVYSEPITLTENTVIRTFCTAADSLPGSAATYSYILNASHDLPVLSITTFDTPAFTRMYNDLNPYTAKSVMVPAHAEYFREGEVVFSADCGVKRKGQKSIEYPNIKKSMGLDFTCEYGSGKIDCPLFTESSESFNKLTVRGGIDFVLSRMRTELVEGLCVKLCPELPTQRSEYCAVYIDGMYYGLMTVKDDITRSFYAKFVGAENEGIEVCKGRLETQSLMPEELQPILDHITEPEAYEQLREVFNVDAFIDWVLLESFCYNGDLAGNVRFYRTPGGQWTPVLYDLDEGFSDKAPSIFQAFDNLPNYIYQLSRTLLRNPEFKAALKERGEELYNNGLDRESVLAEIDSICALIESEVVYECKVLTRPNCELVHWQQHVEQIRTLLDTEKCLNYMRNRL